MLSTLQELNGSDLKAIGQERNDAKIFHRLRALFKTKMDARLVHMFTVRLRVDGNPLTVRGMTAEDIQDREKNLR